jgi:hypothetical protein
MNKIKKMAALVGVVVVVITCIYFGYNYYTTREELLDTQKTITTIQNNLNVESEKAANLSVELIEVREELSRANEVIASRDDEVYFVDCEVTENELRMIAKTVWGEARGQSTIEKAAVIWCILNRVDKGHGSIARVITAPNQFSGYSKNHPVTDELYALAKDVVARWKLEKICSGGVGRVLPKDYLWFLGYDGDNHFRNKYKGDYNIWDWDCWNPYS